MTEAHYLPNSIDAPLVDVEHIANKHRDAFVAATELLAREQALPETVNDPADLELLAAHVRGAIGASKALDAARTTEKTRFDDAGKQVQGLFKPRLDKLDATKAVALGRINDHNRKVEEQERQRAAEAARIQREEADRRMAAAASLEDKGLGDVGETVMQSAMDAQDDAARLDKVATGSAADLVRVQTGAGTVTSSTTMAHEITDAAALRASLGPLGDFIDQASIDKAIRAYMKAQKLAGRAPSIAGVRFFAQSSARVR